MELDSDAALVVCVYVSHACLYVSMCLCVTHLDSDTALVANQPQKPSRHFFHCAVCVRKREGVSVCVCVCVCARGRGTNKPSRSRCPHTPRAVTVYNQEISNHKNRQDKTHCITTGQITCKVKNLSFL